MHGRFWCLMKPVYAKRNYLLLDGDGRINYPYSKYLTSEYTNPHTRELVAQSLRVLHRFCSAHQIQLTLRALEGRCLTYDEAKKLAELCYLPLSKVESIRDKTVVSLTSAKAGKAPKELPQAVEPNTARKRLIHIAGFLDYFFIVFIEPHVRAASIRGQLKYEYDKTTHQLRDTIRGTKQSHHLAIKSLPTEKYLSIIKAIYLRPRDLFQSEAEKPSRTLLRDRAMALLACEGLRPGTIGNITLADFLPNTEKLVIKDNRAKRSKRITTSTPTLKLGDSTLVNSASETLITLWPFTVRAIDDYLKNERSEIIENRLINRSKGFLFISNRGTPINHRGTITDMFNKLGMRLSALGLLDIGDDPYFQKQKQYDFYGYVLRHSAASFFLHQKCIEYAEQAGVKQPHDYRDVPDRVKDLMKLRFGWVPNSNMPELYAARALSENASTVLMDFNQDLLAEAAALKSRKESENGV